LAFVAGTITVPLFWYMSLAWACLSCGLLLSANNCYRCLLVGWVLGFALVGPFMFIVVAAALVWFVLGSVHGGFVAGTVTVPLFWHMSLTWACLPCGLPLSANNCHRHLLVGGCWDLH
jgi:hypothetical protein